MTKVVLVSDLHVHPWAAFSKLTKQGINDRLLDCITVLSDVRMYCEQHSITSVIFGGDLFHVRGRVFTQAYNLVVTELVAFKNAGINLYVVDGNHDQVDRAGTINAVEALATAELVQAVRPTKGWARWSLNGLYVYAYAYCDDRKLLPQRVEASLLKGDDSQRIAVFHHGFKGARVGTSLEYEVKEPLDASQFKGVFDHIFSGHYHAHQDIDGLKRACYIGSPLQHKRGEAPDDKGFLVYDSMKNKYTLVPLKRPKFLTVHEDDLRSMHVEDLHGNFIDVVHNSVSTDKLRDLLEKADVRGINFVREKKEAKHAPQRQSIAAHLSPREVLKHYFADEQFKDLDRKELVRMGLTYLNKEGET